MAGNGTDKAPHLHTTKEPWGIVGKNGNEKPEDKIMREALLSLQMGTLGILFQAAHELVPVLLCLGPADEARAEDKITEITVGMVSKLTKLVMNLDETQPETKEFHSGKSGLNS